ncbi:MAG: D-tyrosyl-tRNA(Tyr) deacylase [Oceanicoccus sp.]|jgi:D-tyrosyl-tRNA(Tyr) deacylase
MRAVIQRVLKATVTINEETVGQIGPGLLVYLGVVEGDSNDDLIWLAEKIVKLRIFPDSRERMQYPVTEVAGGILIISQFTLCADLKNGARPNFSGAAKPEEANEIYEEFIRYISEKGIMVQAGVFGAHMQVESVNDGPVTIIADSNE